MARAKSTATDPARVNRAIELIQAGGIVGDHPSGMQQIVADGRVEMLTTKVTLKAAQEQIRLAGAIQVGRGGV